MCNGFSTRTSQGGSIAVLRSTIKDHTDQAEEWRLLFSNGGTTAPDLGTVVELRGSQSKRRMWNGRCWVVIHRDGDLSAPEAHLPPSRVSPMPFFSFTLDAETESTTQLPERLDLGFGDNGIIGRKVSVMTGSIKGPVAIAEGVIGWN